MAFDKERILQVAKSVYPEIQTYEYREQLSLIIPSEYIILLAEELKNNPLTSFDMLIDITAIDMAKGKYRFEVIYFLWSNKYKNRIRIKVPLEGDYPTCPSITSIWESANWYERETYDMYGLKFENHPNLRRFYLPEDFKDPETKEPLYPLRKEFPLMGIPGSLPLPPYPEKYGPLE